MAMALTITVFYFQMCPAVIALLWVSIELVTLTMGGLGWHINYMGWTAATAMLSTVMLYCTHMHVYQNLK
jgi:hypothetical protein